MNTSLHTHAQTLSLLALQRSTPNLPFQLIVPGRTLLKRDSLFQVERSAPPREREFLLFSDCLVWLAEDEGWGLGWGSPSSADTPSPHARPGMMRSRSKSEAELTTLWVNSAPNGNNGNGNGGVKAKSVLPLPRKKGKDKKKRQASSGAEERWVFKGRAELVDVEVIVSPQREVGEERRFEVLSPEGSFVLYAGVFPLEITIHIALNFTSRLGRRARRMEHGNPTSKGTAARFSERHPS